MSIGVAPEVLENGPAYIRDHCTRIVAVAAFTPGNSYATATAAGNVIASVDVTSGEFTFSDGPAGARVLNNPAKIDAAADAAGDPTHFLFLDVAASKILRWTNETTTGAVGLGGVVTIPNIPLVSRQPVVA